MPILKKDKNSYHHGNLAESLLNAVDEIATKFGLEAVSLRACAKLVGVSPSSAFRHYADKRALLTAFATRALTQLSEQMETASQQAQEEGSDAFSAVGLAYIDFALTKPAFFRAVGNGASKAQKLVMAKEMIQALGPAFASSEGTS